MGQYCSCAKGKRKKTEKFKNKPILKKYDYKEVERKNETLENNSNNHGNNLPSNGLQRTNHSSFHSHSVNREICNKYNTLNSFSSHNKFSNYHNNSKNDIASTEDSYNYLNLSHSTYPLLQQHHHLNHNESYSQNSLSNDTSTNLDYTSLDNHPSLLTTNTSQSELQVHTFCQRNSHRVVALLERVLDYLVEEVDGYYLQVYCNRMRQGSEREMAKEEVRNVLWDVLTGQEGEDFVFFCELLSDDEHHKKLVELLVCLECVVSFVSTFPHPSQLTCQHHNSLSDPSYFNIDLVTPPLYNPPTHSNSLSSSMSLCSLDKKPLNRSTKAFTKHNHIPQVSLTLTHFCFCSPKQEGRLFQLLSESSALVDISLLSCHFSEDTSMSFVAALGGNRSLQKLHISSSPLHPSSFQPFLQALTNLKPTLKSFEFTHSHSNPPQLHSLISTISTQTYLYELDLSFNELTSELSEALSHLLSTTTTLKHLNIKNTHLTATSFKPLSTSLSHNSTLHSLNISNNHLQDPSINSLSHSLILNSSVRSINLSKCSFTHLAATSISRSLKANHSLQQLTLSNNQLGNSGLICLSSSLCYNQSLLLLEMDWCGVGNGGFYHLLKALKHHRKIRVVKLCHNHIGRPERRAGQGCNTDENNNNNKNNIDSVNIINNCNNNNDSNNTNNNNNNKNNKNNIDTTTTTNNNTNNDNNNNNNTSNHKSTNNNSKSNDNNSRGDDDDDEEEEDGGIERLFMLMKEVLHLNPLLKLYLRGNHLTEHLSSSMQQ